MNKKYFVATLITAGSLFLSAPLANAAPAVSATGAQISVQTPSAQKAVHKASFKTGNGHTVDVITLSDGSVLASLDGAPYVGGASAMDLLNNQGIGLSIAPTGEILGQTLSNNVSVAQAPRPVTPTEANAAAQAVQAQPSAAPAAQSAPIAAPILSALPTSTPLGSSAQQAAVEPTASKSNGNPASK